MAVNASARPRVRAYAPRDEEAILRLVAADVIPGQPDPTRDMVEQALSGRSAVDGAWWEELHDLRVDALVDTSNQVVGVVSFAARRRDDAGLLLWLHGREQDDVVAALVDHALRQLHGHAVLHAFDFASALSLGLEAHPVRHRPATHRVLVDADFVGTDLWRYMHRTLPCRTPGIDSAGVSDGPVITAEASHDPPGWTLTARLGGTRAGEVSVGAPTAGIGVLWWIDVEAAFRERRVGRTLLQAALDHLAAHGAEEVVLYVDDDEPDGDRDRTAANRLYDSFGFVEVDRLYSYRLGRQPRRVSPTRWNSLRSE